MLVVLMCACGVVVLNVWYVVLGMYGVLNGWVCGCPAIIDAHKGTIEASCTVQSSTCINGKVEED